MFLVLATALLASGYIAVAIAPEQKLSYFLRYWWDAEVTWDQIAVAKKPHDCDFFGSPMGSKYCHYEPLVTSRRLHRDAQGRMDVSYDAGATWRQADRTEIATGPYLTVTWRKVED